MEDDWSQKMQYDQFQSSYEQAQTKLAKHWKQVGFLPIPDSKWRIWYSFPEDRLPDPLWNWYHGLTTMFYSSYSTVNW